MEGLLRRAGIEIDGPRPSDVQVHNDGFYDRVLSDGSLGLGESYLDRWWECPRIDELVCRIVEADLERSLDLPWRARLAALRARMVNLQTAKRATRVVRIHYDLEVRLFERMLGPSMAYSCAYWKDAADLDQAQGDKHALVCRKLQIGGRDRVLDIGCGFGGLVRHVAREIGCPTTGVTNSASQHAYAQRLCEGLPVRILLADYRAPVLGGGEPFDKIACIGMFEHVGVKNHRAFMEVVHERLAAGGLFLLQTVGRSRPSGATDPWVDKYVFPDGMLPSAAEIAEAVEGLFVIEDWHGLGADYDRTLMAWHRNFEGFAAEHEAALGRRFCRMWRYYLLSFAGNFRSRRGPQLWQIVLSKGGVKGGYRSVR
ncbi:MAG TPA: cyclopropane fatty acyl phospholipid synthase [Vicinamibacteria bacterium]|nr:cyclopropane fatty acyl phospholipid synthase [Vicinamibacteria bacterium]